MISQIAPGLWVFRQSSSFLGISWQRIMTVIRLQDATLAVHAPIRMTPELITSVKLLGKVSMVIAPTSFHYQAAIDCAAIFPEAKLLYAQAIDGQLPESLEYVKNKIPLDAFAFSQLAPSLEALPIQGMPYLNECVFYHRASQTLLSSHLFQWNVRAKNWLMRFVGRIFRCDAERLSLSRLCRLCIRDQVQFFESLAKANLWPIRRFVLSHGTITESADLREVLKR